MSAPLLATLVWLLSSTPSFGWADPVTPPKRPVVVYLRTDAGQPDRPLEEMKREAGVLMETAGYSLEWRSIQHEAAEPVEAPIVVVAMHGVCQPPQRADVPRPLMAPSSLASTAISDGEVLPFATVECETLSRMVAPALMKQETKQDFLYGRAMGRLVAHELYHILTKTRDHDDGGIGKSHFSAKDILRDRFDFDAVTLARFRDPAAEDAGAEEGLLDAGR
jgi:hypothetical protein